MKRITTYKNITILCLTLLLVSSKLSIAQTKHTFTGVGSADSGGQGYKSVTLSNDGGTRIMKASNNILVDAGEAFTEVSSDDPLVFSFKADGTNAASWDVTDFEIYSFRNEFNFGSSTITFKDKDGQTLATMTGASTLLGQTAVSADDYFGGDDFPVANVAEIEFSMAGTFADDNFTISSITLSNIKAPVTDNTAPTIASANMLNENGIVATGDQIYRNGDTVFVGITYDEEITYTGTPYISITSLSANASLLRLSSDSKTAIFGYEVYGESDNTALTIADAITLNGGTITDLAGNVADLTFSLTVPSGSITNSFDNINASDIVSTSYPNPTTTGVFNIDLKVHYHQLSVNIRDAQGQQLETFTFSDDEEVVFNLPEAKGLYFIELLTEEGKAAIKAIRQ